jgi:hypothetical protein
MSAVRAGVHIGSAMSVRPGGGETPIRRLRIDYIDRGCTFLMSDEHMVQSC